MIVKTQIFLSESIDMREVNNCETHKDKRANRTITHG